MRRSRSAFGCLTLLLCLASALEAQQGAEAEAAWNAGDHAEAERLYSVRLAADSSDLRALHRMALLRAWNDRHAESLALFDRLLRVAPDNTAAVLDRARVLAWSGDHGRAIDAVDAVLAREPDHREALAAHAQFTSWAGRFDASVRSYERLLEMNPGDLEAKRGLARVSSWSGRLREGEARWQEALAAEPNDVATLTGLAAVQRWRGRNAEALHTLQRAAALEPNNPEVLTQLGAVRATLAPRVGPGVMYESDSDGNRIVTSTLSFAYSPTPRLQIRADGYVRDLGFGHSAAVEEGVPVLEERSHGLTVGLAATLPGSWTLAAGAGGSGSTFAEEVRASYSASISTPHDLPLVVTASFARTAFDATAALVRNQVELTDFGVRGTFRSGGFSAASRLSHGTFHGSQDNRRTFAYGELFQRVSRPLSLGVSGTVLRFEKNLQDGYFDPSIFGIALVGARWTRELGRWHLSGEVAPGVQKIGRHGALRGAAQTSARLGFQIAPGRELAVSAGYSTNGISELTAQGVDYRYRNLGMSAAWAF